MAKRKAGSDSQTGTSDAGPSLGHELVIYSTGKGPRVQARFDGETLWLTQAQLAELFGRDVSVISRHIAGIVQDGELPEESNLQKMQIAGSTKPVAFSSLDMAISVGYRVNSVEGTRFRLWANRVLKEYIVKGFSLDDD